MQIVCSRLPELSPSRLVHGAVLFVTLVVFTS
jgi:hypothetical protein